MVSANLVVEDELSEAIVRRILSKSTKKYYIRVVYARGGYGHIKKNIRRYNVASQRTPFIVLTDLDTHNCAPELINAWLATPIARNLLFQVAVHEPEAWVLADHQSIAKLLGIPATTLPAQPEDILDPKLHLLTLANSSRFRRVREGLVRSDFGNLMQGPDYNGILSRYVSETWNPAKAEARCPSLLRMRRRLDTFSPHIV